MMARQFQPHPYCNVYDIFQWHTAAQRMMQASLLVPDCFHFTIQQPRSLKSKHACYLEGVMVVWVLTLGVDTYIVGALLS